MPIFITFSILTILLPFIYSENFTIPEQIHFAYGGSNKYNNDGMLFIWSTYNDTATSTVNYGYTPNELTFTATGTSSTYLPLSFKGAMVHHRVTLTNLQPHTLYYYQVGDSNGGWSNISTFRTAPVANDKSIYPFLIPTYADMGIYNSKNSMIDIGRVLNMENESLAIPFIWHAGDEGYPDDALLYENPLNFGYETTYNYFLRNMSDVFGYMQYKPYLTLPGNHEAECHSLMCIVDSTLRTSLANFTAYNTRWYMPYASSNSTSSMWYSFRYGSIHFVNIDTETDFPQSPSDGYVDPTGNFGNQLEWLNANLADAANDRANGLVTWILVAGHRPMYTRQYASAAGVPSPLDAAAAIQAAFEPLFAKYGVDLYICGHQHSYETIWPVYNSTNVWNNYTNPPYTTHIISGAAGNVEGFSDYNNTPTPPWARSYITTDFGISTILFHNDSALTFNFRRATDGTELDSWTLIRPH